jgi:hypothetical protein
VKAKKKMLEIFSDYHPFIVAALQFVLPPLLSW